MFFVILKETIENRKNKFELKQFLRPLIVFLPGVLLLLSFVLNNNKFAHDPPRHLSGDKLIEILVELGPIITLNKEKEIMFTTIIFYSYCVLAILIVINNIRKRKEAQTKNNLFWFALALIVLALYFIFPDWLSSGGFISVRLALFFFLMIVVWIGSAALPPVQLILPVVTILTTHVFFMNYHNEETKVLSSDAIEATSAEAVMEENTVLLPLNYSNNWIKTVYPAFPNWVMALISAVLAVTIGVIIWRRLRESDLLKYEFITTVTHKFRTPLTHIKWSSDNLLKSSMGEPEREQIEHIKTANLKLIELTNLLVKLPEVESGAYDYHFRRGDISNVAQETVDSLTRSAKIKNINIVKNINPELAANFDSNRIKFVI
jgi:signal transduction histidine kinase